MVRWFPLIVLTVCVALLETSMTHADYAADVDAAATHIDDFDVSNSRATDEKGDYVGHREFERFLRERFPGSYVFYMKLSEVDRAEVVAEFNNSQSIGKTRKLIMERFLKR